ncbi:hypothetical protein MN608_10800 [Microdochium nivale]|nr:hypothetical protein MN608_10800 [Microdochium nivale]
MPTSTSTTQVVEPITTQRFMPLDFNIYSGGSSPRTFGRSVDADQCFLGPHRKTQLFAITNKHNSLRARPSPCIVLHDGLRPQSPALGTVVNAHVEDGKGHHFWDRYSISVMAYGDDFSGLFVTETLRAVQTGTKHEPRTVLRFAMDIDSAFARDCESVNQHRASKGSGLLLERQKFEWREVFTTGTDPGFEPRSEGWRLVARAKPDDILALCVPNGRSRNKVMRFEFCGQGRVAGRYGVSWELMAIMSGLTICHRLSEINGSIG